MHALEVIVAMNRNAALEHAAQDRHPFVPYNTDELETLDLTHLPNLVGVKPKGWKLILALPMSVMRDTRVIPIFSYGQGSIIAAVSGLMDRHAKQTFGLAIVRSEPTVGKQWVGLYRKTR